MSFLDQIKCFNRTRLKLVDTRVTTVCGNVVVERRDGELGTVSLSEAEQRGAGFVVDTKPDYQVACVTLPSHTSERLSFGSQDVAYCAELIKVNNITHVLSLIPTDSLDILYKSVDGIKHVVHKQIDVLDVPEFHITDCLDECFEFINSGLIDNGHVFVHCNAGVSRSATVVIAYLMKFYHMSYLEAFQLVKRVRPVCRPNAGFDKQLREYETELKSIKNILWDGDRPPQIDETILGINGSCTPLCQNGEVEPDISWSFQISDSLGLVSLQDRRLSIISGTLTEIAVRSDVQNVDTGNVKASEVGLVTLPLRASLFQFSPPTLHFSYADEIDHAVLESVKSVMIWQLTSTTPRILKKILINSGFKFTKQLDTWIGTWTKNVRAYEFQNLASYQKFNHFPGTFQIGRKDRLWRTIYRMQQLHSHPEFGFVPDTFILPNDLKKLLSTWKSEKNEHRWIVKPPASARGKGVHIIHRLDQLPKRGSFVIQKYLSKPYLINGTKFDLRVYVYVTSFNPLRIYVYEDGLVRFASVRFSNATHSLNDRYMHLTNCTVNKNHSSYTISKDNKSCDGQKWSLKAFWTYLQSNGIDTDEIWNSMADLIIKTIISCEPSVHTLCRGNVSSGYLCHEMFGFDIILDHDLKPWLLEVNVSPSLDSKSSLDKEVKGKMMAELLNLAGYKLPPHLSKSGQKEVARILKIDSSSVCFNVHTYQSGLSNDELVKQTKFAVFERDLYLNNILENITTKDVVYLTEAEDELNRSEFFQRIFPSQTSFNYHKYFKSPQYYTNLLDAWEHKYWGEREIGRQLLWKLSEQFKFLMNSVNNSAPEHSVTTSRRCRNRTCGVNVKLRTRRRSATSSYRKEVSFKRRCIFYQ